MARIKTQDDFIKRATELHGDFYDYSLVDYIKSSEKVKIICPIHGLFEQTPNKHLRGQGCKQCGINRTKVKLDDYINRAKFVHGNKYDYSKVQYVNSETKVIIICPEHGEFLQTLNCHVNLKQNCPKCAAIAGGKKRIGDNNVMRKEEVKQKVQATCIKKYGTKTYAESDEGRKKLHDIITSDDVQQKTINTCYERYGSKNWTQSNEGHAKLHQIMSSDEMQTKIKQGYISNYGVSHYMKTDEGRNKARVYMMSYERKVAIRNAFMHKYGKPNALLVPEVQEKIHRTNLNKYGVKYIGACSKVTEKSWKTRRYNGTFNTSKPEDTLYLLLCDVFGKDDIIRQYVDDIRYPFHCDFYIKSLDIFIELNAHWSHGGHWFDKNNCDDIEMLSIWSLKNSRFYDSAIHVWTVRDLMKRQCAFDNALNYLVFWNNDLTDAKEWLNQYL